jgi:hypothetical protein
VTEWFNRRIRDDAPYRAMGLILRVRVRGEDVAILGFMACSHGFGFEFRLGLGNGVELTN